MFCLRATNRSSEQNQVNKFKNKNVPVFEGTGKVLEFFIDRNSFAVRR